MLQDCCYKVLDLDWDVEGLPVTRKLCCDCEARNTGLSNTGCHLGLADAAQMAGSTPDMLDSSIMGNRLVR